MAITRARLWRGKDSTIPLPKVVLRARRKFLKFFPDGFQDATYLEWERTDKGEAHEAWAERLSDETFRIRLEREDFAGIAADAVRIESRTNLFGFEKTALRDGLRSPEGARLFAQALYEWLYGPGEGHGRTRRAAFELGFDFSYQSQPAWETYESLLAFAREVKRDTRDLHPRDMIDVQSFIRVQGSDEYD